MMRVHRYWHDYGELPHWLHMVARSGDCATVDVTWWNAEDYEHAVREWYGADFRPHHDLCHAHKADFMRMWVLYNHGGLYLDADCMIVSYARLRELLDDNCRDGTVFIQEFDDATPDRLQGSLVYADANSTVLADIMADWGEAVTQPDCPQWTTPNSIIISRQRHRVGVLPWRVVGPFQWNEYERYITPVTDDEFQDFLSRTSNQCGYMFFNKNMAASLYRLTQNEIVASDLLSCRLLAHYDCVS